jgi:hypothetical protein
MTSKRFRPLSARFGPVTLGAAVTALVLATGGCVGYRLGSMLPPDIKTVYVTTFVNRTSEPQLEARTTGATIAEFQKDATLKVVSGLAAADTRLDVTLLRFSEQPLRYQSDRPKTADEYRITIKAEIVFRRVSTGVVLVKKQVEGDATFVVRGDLTSSKRAAIPEAARDLAHDIVESVVESW